MFKEEDGANGSYPLRKLRSRENEAAMMESELRNGKAKSGFLSVPKVEPDKDTSSSGSTPRIVGGEAIDLTVLPPIKPAFLSSLFNAVKEDKVNLLLIFLPLAVIAKYARFYEALVFIFSSLAIVPLSNLLGKATEELGMHSSDAVAGFLNATFGNMIELIVATIALYKNMMDVVKASMLGSIIGNLLLVAGTAFVAAGIKEKNVKFSAKACGVSGSLLTLTVMGVLLPGAMLARADYDHDDGQLSHEALAVSRMASIVLLATYVQFLFFQMKTHRDDFDDDDNDEQPSMSVASALFLLAIVTLAVSFCGEFLVGSIEGVANSFNISRVFISIILVPIVGNVAEHATAVTMAMRGKMNLAMSVVVSSSTQIAMLVIPVCVLFGWAINRNMGLDFQLEQSIVLLVSILLTQFVTLDGETNWLEGSMLLAAYVIIAGCFFFHRNLDTLQ